MQRKCARKIRNEILKVLEDGPKSINQIAKEIGSTWLTVKKHMEYLFRSLKVELVYNGPKTKLYKLKNGYDNNTVNLY